MEVLEREGGALGRPSSERGKVWLVIREGGREEGLKGRVTGRGEVLGGKEGHRESIRGLAWKGGMERKENREWGEGI